VANDPTPNIPARLRKLLEKLEDENAREASLNEAPVSVTVRIPTLLHAIVEELAALNAETTEGELVAWLHAGMAVRIQTVSARPRGRPPKDIILKIYDRLLDFVVLREVSRRPKGMVSETIKHLQKKEPFKSAGDLRRRYNRLTMGRAKRMQPDANLKVVFTESDGTSRAGKLDDLFTLFSFIRAIGGDNLSEEELQKALDEVVDAEVLKAGPDAVLAKLEAFLKDRGQK
jgi:hypothetical protein